MLESTSNWKSEIPLFLLRRDISTVLGLRSTGLGTVLYLPCVPDLHLMTDLRTPTPGLGLDP